MLIRAAVVLFTVVGATNDTSKPMIKNVEDCETKLKLESKFECYALMTPANAFERAPIMFNVCQCSNKETNEKYWLPIEACDKLFKQPINVWKRKTPRFR